MRRSIQHVIRLAAIAPLLAASPALATGPLLGYPPMHTNQGDLVTHSNQESGWLNLVIEPQPIVLPASSNDSFTVDLHEPWAHGNSPRMTTPPVSNIPAPGTLIVVGLALLGMPARRRHSNV